MTIRKGLLWMAFFALLEFTGSCGSMFLTMAHAQDQTNPYCGPGNVPAAVANDGPAALPVRCMFTQISSTPSSNYPKTVGPTDSLAAALATAVPGDVINVDPANVTMVGSTLTLPNGDAQHWITIRTAVTSVPDEYTRVRLTDAPQLPKIVIAAQNAHITGGSYVRLIGFEIQRKAGTGIVYNLFNGLGHDVILDRVYAHGNPGDTTVHGVNLSNAYNVTVMNSYLSDFHCMAAVDACTDAQAINGGLSTLPDGNYKIINNYIEAAGENILFGGGGASVVPTDILLAYNDINKPMSWNPSDPSYAPAIGRDGLPHPYVVKNLIEFKNARRVVVEGNRLTNVWGGFTQKGTAILDTPKSQAGANGSNLCPLCAVTDVTVRYNYVSYAAQAFQIGCGPSDNGGWPSACGQFIAHDNVFDHLQYPTCYQCQTFVNQIAGGGLVTFANVYVVNNTFTNDPAGFLKPPADPAASTTNAALLISAPIGGNNNIHFDGNQFDPGLTGVYSTGGGAGNCINLYHTINDIITNCWPGGSMTGNMFVTTVPIVPSRLPWPAGNGVANAGASMTQVNAALANRR